MEPVKLLIEVETKGNGELADLVKKFNEGNASYNDRKKLLAELNKIAKEELTVNNMNVDANQKLAHAVKTLNDSQRDHNVLVGAGNAEYFKLGTELRGRTRQSFTAFNGIIQDSTQFSYGLGSGLRAVGNNIEFFTQNMQSSMAKGMTFKQFLSGMTQNLLSPTGGLLFAVSALTAGFTLLFTAMDEGKGKSKDSITAMKEQEQEMQRIKQTQSEILALQYELNDISADKYKSILQEQLNLLKLQRDKLLEIWFLKKEVFDPSKFKNELRTPGFTSTGRDATGTATDFDEEKAKKRNNLLMTYEAEMLRIRNLMDQIDEKEEKRNKRSEEKGRKFYDPEKKSPLSNMGVTPDGLLYKEPSMMEKLFAFEKQSQIEKNYLTAIELDTKRNILRSQYEANEIDEETYIQQLRKLQAIYQEKGAQEDVRDIKKEIIRLQGKQVQEEKLTAQIGMSAVRSIASTIDSQLSPMWEKMFGHANSLLEIFAQQFISTMTSLATKYAIFSLLGAFLPGSSPFLGAVGKAFGFMAEGGVITEPVIGRGLNTGRGYVLGERGSEKVTPMETNVIEMSHNDYDRQTMQEIRIPVYIGDEKIEDIVINKYKKAVRQRKL